MKSAFLKSMFTYTLGPLMWTDRYKSLKHNKENGDICCVCTGENIEWNSNG